MFQPHERTLSIKERLTADLSEIAGKEPPNDWFNVNKLDQEGNVAIGVTEKFLKMGGHRMEISWRAWNRESEQLACGQIPASLSEFVRGNLRWYSMDIVIMSGFTPEQITSKIQYLQTHGGTDHFGRHLKAK